MNCKQVEEHLADYLGEELDEPKRAAVDVHLRSCQSCRSQVAALGLTVDRLRSLSTVSEGEARVQTASLVVVRRLPVIYRFAFTSLKAAAMIALGVALGWAVFGHGPDVETPSAPDVQLVDEGGADGGFHPQWYARGRQVAARPSSFARHLAMIAPARD